MGRVLAGLFLVGLWQLVPPTNLRLVQGIPSSSGTVVTITAPTSSPTYDAGTAATLTTLAGTAQANQAISACTWTNSLGGSGSATGTATWTVASIALTVGTNVITVTCPNAIGTGTDVLTVTRSSGALTCTTTTANLTPATVQTALNNAATNDVVCLPTGSATWSTTVTFPADADVTLAGSAGATIVDCTGTPGSAAYVCAQTGTVTQLTCNDTCLQFDQTRTGRITGLRIIANVEDTILWRGDQASTKHTRLDHNNIISTTGWNKLHLVGGDNSVNAQALVDHNVFEDGITVLSIGTLNQLDDPAGNTQHVIWAEEPTWGGGTKMPFIEANYFHNDAVNTTNYGDGNYGARAVIRYNTYVGSTAAGLEFHSVQGANRSYQHWEIYGNHFKDLDINANCFWGPLFIRGGTGVAWGNDTSGDNDECDFMYVFDNVRSDIDEDLTEIPFDCDGSGTTGWDQNTVGQFGWRCRDQIGISHDTVQWEDSPATAWNQALKPAMVWLNRVAGTLKTFDINDAPRNSTHIQANRDYYDHSTLTTSTQTVGIRAGTAAAMAAVTTCTQGVGFWVTDEGEWDSTNGATADGRLYRCGASNNWGLYYTPYTYPHPWGS